MNARERKTDQRHLRVNFSGKGSERSPVALSYVCEIRKAARTAGESVAGRDGHLAQKVSSSSPRPWLVFTVILSSTWTKKPSALSGCKGHVHRFQQNDVMFLVSGLLSLLCGREAASSAWPLIAPKWKCPDNPMLPLSIFVVFIFNWSCKGFYSSDLSHFSRWHLLAWLAFYSLSSHTNSTSSPYQHAHQNSSAYVGNSLLSDVPHFCATFWNACTFDWMTVIFSRH